MLPRLCQTVNTVKIVLGFKYASPKFWICYTLPNHTRSARSHPLKITTLKGEICILNTTTKISSTIHTQQNIWLSSQTVMTSSSLRFHSLKSAISKLKSKGKFSSISNNENENTVDAYLRDATKVCHRKIYYTKWPGENKKGHKSMTSTSTLRN